MDLKQHPRVFFNTLSGCFRLFVNALILFFLTPFIIHSIGQSEFGLWSLIISTIGFFEILDVGLSLTVIKYVAQTKAENDQVKCNTLLSTTFVIYFLLAALGALGVGLLSIVFNSLFQISAEYRSFSQILIFLVACRSLLVVLPFSLFKGVLFAEQFIVLTNAISLLANLVYAMSVWIALSKGWGIVALPIISLAAAVLEYGAYTFFSFFLDRHLTLRRSLVSFKEFREVLPFSASQFFAHIGSVVLLNSDLIIIKLFLPLSAVGLYAVPLKITTFGYMLLSQFSHTLTPLIVQTHTLKDPKKIYQLFLHGAIYVLIPSTLLLVSGGLSAKELLTFWINPDYGTVSTVLILLLFAMWVTSFYGFGSDILQLTGYHHLGLKYSLIAVVTNLILTVILVKPFQLEGVAMGTLLANLTALFLVLRKIHQIQHISILRYIREIFPLVLIPGLVQVVILMGLKTVFPPQTLLNIIFINIPPILASLAVSWALLAIKGKIDNFYFK